MKLVILAGGKGTRLGLKDTPKPMVKISGKPLLVYHIELAVSYGIREIIILSHYKSDVIKEFIGSGSKWGIKIVHIVEPEPLGTAGAIQQLASRLTERFLVFYGDLFIDFDIDKFIEFDSQTHGLATLMVHPNNHPYDSDLVATDECNKITNFFSKPHSPNLIYKNLVNAAVYILSPDIFKFIKVFPSDFGKDIFPLCLDKNENLFAYISSEYVKDIGTPERLSMVEKDLRLGKPARRNCHASQKAIFLDRDGVINDDVGGVTTLDGLSLLPGVVEAIKLINDSDYLAIVITNQAVVAKGFCSSKMLETIHNGMETALGKEGAFLDGIYFCPHYPESGYAGEVASYKVNCNCRKPKPGMIIKASRDWNIDLGLSFFIGDQDSDIQAGHNAGVASIWVKKNGKNEANGYYEYPEKERFNNLNDAVRGILSL